MVRQKWSEICFRTSHLTWRFTVVCSAWKLPSKLNSDRTQSEHESLEAEGKQSTASQHCEGLNLNVPHIPGRSPSINSPLAIAEFSIVAQYWDCTSSRLECTNHVANARQPALINTMLWMWRLLHPGRYHMFHNLKCRSCSGGSVHVLGAPSFK